MTSFEQEQADFLEFWAAYPRREARADAWRAWQQIARRRPPVADLVTAVRAHISAHEWCAERRRFIPLPATWLRGERWADELEVPEEILPTAAPVKPPAARRGGALVDQSLINEANAAWAEVRAANKNGSMPVLGWSDPRTACALGKMGGFSALRDMGERDAGFRQRDFVGFFVALPRPSVGGPNVVQIRRSA